MTFAVSPTDDQWEVSGTAESVRASRAKLETCGHSTQTYGLCSHMGR